jgi:hypothetical protein
MTDVRLTGHLTDTLANIARWYPPTADPPRTLQSQTRTAYGSRPPLPAAVLSLRRQTVDTLTSWALLVCEERDLRGPAKPGDVAALTSFLAAHAEWLAACCPPTCTAPRTGRTRGRRRNGGPCAAASKHSWTWPDEGHRPP